MLFKSSYFRAIATLSSGQILAAIIPFLAAPLLGRIYVPTDYGLLASYTAIVNMSASVVTFNYQFGVLTEKTDLNANRVAFISLLSTVGIALVMIPVAILIYLVDPFATTTSSHAEWFLLLPVSTLVVGASLSAMAVANRDRNYRIIALMLFLAATTSALASLVLGLLGMRGDGLFTANLLSQVVTFGFSVAILFHYGVIPRGSSMSKIRSLAFKHRGYPMFTMPASFVQTISLQLPVFTLIYLSEASLLGSFSRAQSLLILPISMLSGAIGRVYFQRAAEDYNRSGTCQPLFLKTVPLIFGLALPFLVLFAMFGPELFTAYLGERWGQAGLVAQILAPVFFLQMFVGPLGGSILFAGNQRLSIFVHLTGIILASVGIAVPLLAGMPAIYSIVGWAVAICVLNIIQIWLGWELSSTRSRLNQFVQANQTAHSRK